MKTEYIKNPEYVVYETQGTTYDPIKGLKLLGHPVAYYDNYTEMVDEWFGEFLSGTHNFFVAENE